MGDERFDTVVIGARQAGLEIGHYLARQRSDFVIFDAGDRVGQSWDARWDSCLPPGSDPSQRPPPNRRQCPRLTIGNHRRRSALTN